MLPSKVWTYTRSGKHQKYLIMTIEQRVQQLEDRIAVRELIDQYAFCADNRNARGQMAIFTGDTNFEVYMDEKFHIPTQEAGEEKNFLPGFDNLNQYFSTSNFIAKSQSIEPGNRQTVRP